MHGHPLPDINSSALRAMAANKAAFVPVSYETPNDAKSPVLIDITINSQFVWDKVKKTPTRLCTATPLQSLSSLAK